MVTYRGWGMGVGYGWPWQFTYTLQSQKGDDNMGSMWPCVVVLVLEIPTSTSSKWNRHWLKIWSTPSLSSYLVRSLILSFGRTQFDAIQQWLLPPNTYCAARCCRMIISQTLLHTRLRTSVKFKQNHGSSEKNDVVAAQGVFQSGLPRPIPRKSVESEHGCTSRIYFDNAGDNVNWRYITWRGRHRNHVNN